LVGTTFPTERRYGHGLLVLLRDPDLLRVRNGRKMAAFRLPLEAD
jgi:hypothetical protein